MNEITHIHLGRQPFTIAVDAHRALRAYLTDIEHEVGKDSDVMEEVELRMAELLGERGITPEKTILAKDVEYLKQQLGEPGDFTDADERKPGKQEPEPEAGKRLFRDPEHGMIAGVSAGLAAYLGIDPVIVRIIFIVLTFSGGAGVLIYILLWLVVPPVKSGSDRLQLTGKAVTVDNIKKVVQQADVPGVANRLGSTVGRALGVISKILLALVGIGFIISGVAMLLAGATLASFALVHGVKIGGHVLFPVGSKEVLAVVGCLAVVAVLAILSVLAGRAMIRRKWGVPGWVLAALAAVFIAGGGIGAATIADSIEPVRDRYERVQHRELRVFKDPFNDLELHTGNVYVTFTHDSRYAVEIRALGDTDIRKVKAFVQDGRLVLDTGEVATDKCMLICPMGPANMEIVIHRPGGYENLQIKDQELEPLPALPDGHDGGNGAI